jgi:hypothetical protein
MVIVVGLVVLTTSGIGLVAVHGGLSLCGCFACTCGLLMW